MPTGAVYIYKYSEASGCAANTGSGVIALQGGGYKIYRRLLEREEYADGVNRSAWTVFTPTPSTGLDPAHPSRPNTMVTVDFRDGGGTTLRKETHYFYGNPASNEAPPTDDTKYAEWWRGLEFKIEEGDNNGVLQTRTNVWQQRPCEAGEPCWFGDPQAESAPSHDPRLYYSDTTLNGLVNRRTYFYDRYNNVAHLYEHDWNNGGAWSILRHTVSTYKTDAGYVDPNVNLVSLLSTQQTLNSDGVQAAYSTFNYDPKGNLLTKSDFISTDGSGATHTYTYDGNGRVATYKDPENHTTTYGYSTGYAGPTSITNALGQSTSASYDQSTQKPTGSTDLNGVSTNYSYNDSLDRLKQVVRNPGGSGSQKSITTYEYSNPTTVQTYQDLNTAGDGGLHTTSFYDGFGRIAATQLHEAGGQYIAANTEYDALGRISRTINPYRPGDAGAWTTYSYDALGRVKSVQAPDGAQTVTSYSGNTATITDPAGKTRRNTMDGLGRLTKVEENPGGLNYTTVYEYDVLDSLLKVTQGSQVRTFVYDSLRRLLSATNPETGATATTYTYDRVGNLTKKKDARNIETTFAYDALNRIKSKTYSDGTLEVLYTYDDPNVPYSKGYLTQIRNGLSHTNYTAFDPLGRVVSSNQFIGVYRYYFNYGYNSAGSLTSETYPSGRVVTTGYDAANRPFSLSGTLAGQPKTYVAQTGYRPNGALESHEYGNGIWPVYQYNNRLQMNQMWATNNNNPNNFLLYLDWGYGTTNNNGDVLTSTIRYGASVPFTSLTVLTQSYSYDNVNRLSAATESGGYSRNFNYNQYGNMWVTNPTGIPAAGETPQAATWFTGANRLTNGDYDAVGNLLNTGLGSPRTYAYDAENRQKSATISSATTTYGYDGDGQRVFKEAPNGAWTFYIYDAFGQLAAEYTNGNAPAAPCSTCYLTWDALGSTRLITDQAGAVVSRHDFLPFGEEIPAGTNGRGSLWGNATAVTQKFTGQERDAETGNDYFIARYMSGAQGRFLSPDPMNAGADPADPQSWNAYSYVGNNPLARIDPNGLSWFSDLWKGVSNWFSGCGSDFCVTGTGFADRDPVMFDPGYGISGGGGSGGSTQQQPPPPPPPQIRVQEQQPATTPCPAVPASPHSTTLKKNIRSAERSVWMIAALPRAFWFYQQVRNGGPWDYKQQGQSVNDLGKWQASPYQDFGNFNFGATGAAAGIPLQILVRGAGFAQGRAKTSNPSFGHWYDLNPPYGDDPNDQAQIKSGFASYKGGCVQ